MVRGSISASVARIRRRLPGHYRREAEYAGTLTVQEIQRRTPIGRRVHPDTGRDLGPSKELHDSITRMRPKKLGSRIVTGAYSTKSYADHVERGTTSHIIRPRRSHVRHGPSAGKMRTHLRFWSAGQLRYAKSVNHPGTPGYHMFARGLVAAEKKWGVSADARLAVIFR